MHITYSRIFPIGILPSAPVVFSYYGVNFTRSWPSPKREPKKTFWEESHMTPPKFFGIRVYAGQRESTGGMDMDWKPGMTTHGGGVGRSICQRF